MLSDIKKYINDTEVNIIPQVGMGVTFHSGKDLLPGTIVKIFENGKIIFFKDDDYSKIDSFNYNFTFNPDGDLHMAKLATRKNSAVRGKWIENGITGKYANLYEVLVGTKKISINS